MMLAKPVTTTLQQVERSQIYVIATFGGGAAVFLLLFIACCVFSIQQKRPMLRQGVRTTNCNDAKLASHLKSDANDASELVRLNVMSASDDASTKETDSNSSLKCGFKKASPDPESASRYLQSRHSAYKFSRDEKPRDNKVEYQRVSTEIEECSKKDSSSTDEGYKSMSSTSSASVVSTTTSTSISISPEVRDLAEPDVIRTLSQFHAQNDR